MNAYSTAYNVGYYYGRSHGYVPSLDDLPPEDQALENNQGFKDGFAAGLRDYQSIDVAHQAMRSAAIGGMTLGEGVTLREGV